jgi:predicted house-cleaning noncanonical NTP pyrophosphatase (MazG superfamily)
MTLKLLRFRVQKLIRDGMLLAMHARGLRTFERPLDEQEFKRRILDKLVEEAEEVRGAGTRAELLEELADVHEVLLALMAAFGVSALEVEARRIDKHAQYGAFDRRLYNEAVEAPEDSSAATYYLDRPEKYPRL